MCRCLAAKRSAQEQIHTTISNFNLFIAGLVPHNGCFASLLLLLAITEVFVGGEPCIDQDAAAQ
jgi:hypothetical protein